MKARRLGILFGGAAAFLLQGCPDQPELECLISRGAFAAKYTVVSSTRVEGTGECATLAGDLVGVEQYFPANADKLQDTSKSTIAIQTNGTGTARAPDPNPDHKIYSLGKVDANKPKNGLCTASAFVPAQVDLDAVPPAEPEGGTPDTDAGADDSGDDAGAPDASVDTDAGDTDAAPPAEQPAADEGEPAVHLKYEWSNVRFLMKEASPGEAFSADLTVTDSGCVTKYTVNAEYYPPAFGNPSCAGPADDAGVSLPNQFICSSDPDPAHGVGSGTGINPLFKNYITCDPDLFYCVLTTDVEHLRSVVK